MSIKKWCQDILLNGVAKSTLLHNRIRINLYKLAGIKITSNYVTVKPHCLFNGTNVEIGRGSFINYGTMFENAEKITIGKDCAIGMEVMFCSASHEIGPDTRRAGVTIGGAITVEDGCWIGSRVTILPNVTIGKGCVIGANSVVTKDCEQNGLYIGVPAKRVRDL